MALYEKQYTKPYPDGYIDKPVMTTPVTAEILNLMDAVLVALEDFLTSDDAGFKKGLTIGGIRTGSIGNYSIALGVGQATGQNTIAANGCYATGDNAQAFGTQCLAAGINAFASGISCVASGSYARANGSGCNAIGHTSYAEGSNTTAKGACAHAEGNYTIASGNMQHVQGKYNVEDKEGLYAHIVGGGASMGDRKNIHTLDWQGNAVFAGDVTNGNGVSLDGLMALIGTTGQLRTIVTELPTEDISTETIYMVPKEPGSENDIYNEYINVDGTMDGWEFIGSSAVDLTDYYTKEQVGDLLAGYVACETGKGLSSNDYTAEDHALVASIRSMTAADALAILNEEEVA